MIDVIILSRGNVFWWWAWDNLRLHLQAPIEQSDLLSKLSRLIKKFALFMTCRGTLDFTAWSSKSPFSKILIIVCNVLSNRTKHGYDPKSCDEDIFTDYSFSLISSPELQNKLKSHENEDTKIYSTLIKHLIFFITQSRNANLLEQNWRIFCYSNSFIEIKREMCGKICCSFLHGKRIVVRRISEPRESRRKS